MASRGTLPRRVSLDLSGRTLLAHENDHLEDRGFSGTVLFDPDPASERGPSFSLRQNGAARPQAKSMRCSPMTSLATRSHHKTAGAERRAAGRRRGFAAARTQGSGSRPVPATSAWADARGSGLSFEIGATRREGDGRAAGQSLEVGVGSAIGRALNGRVTASREERGATAPRHMIGFEFGLRW